MKITKQNRRDAKELFRACLANGLLDENRVRQAVDAVLAQKPRAYFAVLAHFQRLVRLEQERRTARVESAAPLTPELESGLRASLGQRYGRGLSFVFQANPALIGGVRVQVGSDVFDGSIRARLDLVKSSFETA